MSRALARGLHGGTVIATRGRARSYQCGRLAKIILPFCLAALVPGLNAPYLEGVETRKVLTMAPMGYNAKATNYKLALQYFYECRAKAAKEKAANDNKAKV